MAVQTYKNLGQSFPTTTAAQDVYTVPASTQAIVSSFAVSNQSTTASTSFTISHAVSGVAATTKQNFVTGVIIEARETKIFTIGAALAATDVIRFQVASTTLTLNIWGVELT